VDNAATDTRWPRCGADSAQLGLISCLSVPLLLPAGPGTGRGEAIGALKVYADHPDAFGADSENLLELLAAPAAVIIANIQVHESAEQLSASLKESLHSRSAIDMAKGVLMERLNLDERGALRALTRRSRQEGARLSAIALNVLDRSAEHDHERP
jgi:GAF domain-containing protein